MQKEITSNSCSERNKVSLYYSNMGNEIKDRLRHALEAKNGGNQTELAEYIGVKPQAVQQWMNGKTKPKGNNLEKAAEYLGVTPSYLLFGTNSSINDKHRNEYNVIKLKPNKKITNKRASLILNIIGRLEHLAVDDLERVDLVTKNPGKFKDIKSGNGEDTE